MRLNRFLVNHRLGIEKHSLLQLKKRGNVYLDTFLQKRILPTLVNFDIAVLFFVIVGLLLGNTFSLKQIALSFIAWDSVGNSNWYIFAILVCYTVFLLSFKGLFRKHSQYRSTNGGIVIACIIGVAILILSIFGLASIWLAIFGDVGVALLCVLNALRSGYIKKTKYICLILLRKNIIKKPPITGHTNGMQSSHYQSPSHHLKHVLLRLPIMGYTGKKTRHIPH